MKIIALRGGNSSGKSTTLNLVYDELVNKLGAQIQTPKTVIGDPKFNDFECVVTYLSQTIAFYTMGDYSKLTINAIMKYSPTADMMILATNDRFVLPMRTILTFPNFVLHKTIATPKTPSNIITKNQLDCNTIISQI